MDYDDDFRAAQGFKSVLQAGSKTYNIKTIQQINFLRKNCVLKFEPLTKTNVQGQLTMLCCANNLRCN